MSNNKEIICKLIKAKNQEANSYTDQTCYNAAYCNGYVDGATMALNTLSGVPERHKCYAILSHYSNEDIGTFDSVAICGGDAGTAYGTSRGQVRGGIECQ